MKRRFVIGSLIALCCALPLSAVPAASPQDLPTLGDSDRQELSPLMERKVGEEIMYAIRRDPDYIDDAPLLEYLNMLGNTLVDARPDVRGEANYDFSFFAVRDQTLNAFALPGGFIAVHSQLVLTAQSESELAGVMGHEIGHIAQRHIARMLGQQRKDMIIPLAAMAMAILAASRSNSDAAEALAMGGEGVALQRQLSFSRDAEREADRVGLQIMSTAGFDTSGMVSFFGRLQKATRVYRDIPSFLQNHPMTTERIADMEARIRSLPVHHHIDSLDFQLIRARLRILQDDSTQAMHEATAFFNEQIEQNPRTQTAASKYGLAFIAYKQGAYDKAQTLLREARAAAKKEQQYIPVQPSADNQASPQWPSYEAILDNLDIDIQLGAGHANEAIKLADAARQNYPISRGIARQYASALLAAGRNDEAINYLRDQAQLYRQEPQVEDLLAKAYAADGKQALQHLALAESYALNGNLMAGLEQLTLARKAPDASFYDSAVIDAREREFKDKWNEEHEEDKKKK